MCFERHWVGSSASNTDALNVDTRKHELLKNVCGPRFSRNIGSRSRRTVLMSLMAIVANYWNSSELPMNRELVSTIYCTFAYSV
jgi:hypothetical protein